MLFIYHALIKGCSIVNFLGRFRSEIVIVLTLGIMLSHMRASFGVFRSEISKDKVDRFSQLPEEVLVNIFRQDINLGHARGVSKQFKAAALVAMKERWSLLKECKSPFAFIPEFTSRIERSLGVGITYKHFQKLYFSLNVSKIAFCCRHEITGNTELLRKFYKNIDPSTIEVDITNIDFLVGLDVDAQVVNF